MGQMGCQASRLIATNLHVGAIRPDNMSYHVVFVSKYFHLTLTH